MIGPLEVEGCRSNPLLLLLLQPPAPLDAGDVDYCSVDLCGALERFIIVFNSSLVYEKLSVEGVGNFQPLLNFLTEFRDFRCLLTYTNTNTKDNPIYQPQNIILVLSEKGTEKGKLRKAEIQNSVSIFLFLLSMFLFLLCIFFSAFSLLR